MSNFAKVFIVINLLLTMGLVFLMATLLAQKADYKNRTNEFLRLKLSTAEELERKKADFQLQVHNLKQHIRKLVEDTNTASSAVLESYDKAKQASGENDELTQQLKKLEAEKDNRSKHLGALKDDLRRLGGEMNTAKTRRQNAENKEREWAGKVDTAERKKRSLKSKIDAIKPQ